MSKFEILVFITYDYINVNPYSAHTASMPIVIPAACSRSEHFELTTSLSSPSVTVAALPSSVAPSSMDAARSGASVVTAAAGAPSIAAFYHQ